MERPYWKFYGRDWLSDRELRRCSPAARALWIDMLCLMHEGKPYGHLSDKAGVISNKQLAAFGYTMSQVKKLLAELEGHLVFSRTEDGVMFSRRMVRDEEIRSKRAAGGSLGGNPFLQEKVNLMVNRKVNDNGYPPSHVSAFARADSDLGSEILNSENPLYQRFHDLIAVWDGHKTEIDLGAQVWISLVDAGDIASQNIHELFEGLERWKCSQQWANGYVPSVAKWLAGRRWKDYPKQASGDEKWR